MKKLVVDTGSLPGGSSISVGYGNWRPHPAGEVLHVGYGDCKDKANLLRTMLAAVGIESRLARLYAHDGYPIRFGLPTLNGNTNHMIAIVDLDGRSIPADPTAATVPFGALPINDQEADLLPVSATGARVERAPASAPDDNREVSTIDLTLAGDGTASGAYTYQSTGSFADRQGTRLLALGSGKRADAVLPMVDLRAARSELELPAGYEVSTSLDGRSFQCPVASVKTQATVDRDTITVRRQVELHQGIYAASGYPDVLDALRAFSDARKQLVTLVKEK